MYLKKLLFFSKYVLLFLCISFLLLYPDILLQDSVNTTSSFQNCIAKICRFLLYDLFAVAAYVIKKAVEEKEGASFVTILPSLIYQSFIRYQ